MRYENDEEKEKIKYQFCITTTQILKEVDFLMRNHEDWQPYTKNLIQYDGYVMPTGRTLDRYQSNALKSRWGGVHEAL